MAIKKQSIAVPVGGGLQQKAGEYLVDAPASAVATNVVFNKEGEVQKRQGYVDLAAKSKSGRLGLIGDADNLVCLSTAGAEIHRTLGTTWETTPLPASVTTAADYLMQYSKQDGGRYRGIERFSLQQDSASTDTYTLITHVSGGIEVFNHLTGELVASDQTATAAFAFSINNTYLCALTTSFSVSVFTTATEALSSSTSIGTGEVIAVCNATATLDAAIVYEASNIASLTTFDGTTTTTPVELDDSVHTTLFTAAVCTHSSITLGGGTEGYAVVCRDSTGELDLKLCTDSSLLTTTTGVVANAELGTAFRTTIDIIESPYGLGGAGEVVLTMTVPSNTSGTDDDIQKVLKTVVVSSLGSLATSTEVVSGHAHTKMLLHPDGNHVLCGISSRLDYNYDNGQESLDSGRVMQPICISILRATSIEHDYEWAPIGLVGLYNTQLCHQDTVNYRYPVNWESKGGSVYRFSSATQEGLQVQYEFHDIDLAPAFVPSVSYRGSLYWGGGLLWQFDGQTIREATPLVVPRLTGTTNDSMGGSNITVNWRVTTEWMDAQGLRHRSFPSNVLNDTLYYTGGAGYVDGEMMNIIAPFSDNADNDGKAHRQVSFYRTASGGSVYHQVPFSGATTGTFTDTWLLAGITDEALTTNPLLYTQGELSAEFVPAPYLIAAAGGRLWLVPGEARQEAWYSKLPTPGVAPEFNSTLRVVVPFGDELTAITGIDDKVILFQENRTFVVYGDGYNNAGQGQNFAVEEVNSGVGCIDPRSVVSGTFGAIFRARSGLYMLDRSLQPHYIGAGVEDSLGDDDTITSAVVVADAHEVRFTKDDGEILVFNYLFNQWSTHATLDVIDATMWNNTYTILHADDANNIEVAYESGYQEPGGVLDIITYTYATPWIKLAGLQGFKRVSEASFLFRDLDMDENGDSQSRSDITIKVFYNYDDDTSDTFSFTGEDIRTANSLQADVSIPRQKCQSIKFQVQVADTSAANNGLGAALTGIQLKVGMKDGNYKLPSGSKG